MRKKQPETWKKNVNKKNKYKPSSMPTYPTCDHEGKTFMCKTLSMAEIKKFHEVFYQKYDKQYQDNFLLKYMQIVPVKRRRPTTSTNEQRPFQCKYFVRTSQKKEVPVCLDAFKKF